MLKRHRREMSVAVAIVALCLIMLAVAPSFFSGGNLTDLLLANMPVLIIAPGVTLVILTGQIDISIGSQFAICGVVAGVVARAGVPPVLAGLIACGVGALMGALNGWLVAYVRIPSIVVTLAAMVALRDALRWWTEGAWIQDLPAGFQWLGLSQSGSGLVTATFAALIVITFAWS